MKFKLKAVKETCIAGKTIMQTLKITSGNHGKKRAAKKNITPEKVRENNDRLALKKFTQMLNANFKHGDMHVTLTYENLLSFKEIKKTFDDFIRELRKEMRKDGKELVFVHVIECEHTRPHHHIVINTSDIELVAKLWKYGHIHSSPLDDTGEYSKLAAYLLKETQKTFRTGENPYKRRYSTSRNIIRPVTKREYIDPEELLDEPKPIKGYYIPKNLNRRFEHPVTGIEHLEYTMVALGEPIEYKVWPYGEVVSGREYYKCDYVEEQLII